MKAKNISLWVINILLAALMLFAGSHKLATPPDAVAGFANYGFGVGFLHFIGTCEMLGGVGLLIPRTRFWAAVGFIPIMIGAVTMHLTHNEYSHAPTAVIALVLVLISAFGRRGEVRRIFSSGGLLTGA